MHKYLNRIGVKDDNICVPYTTDKSDSKKRLRSFLNERKKYGFDSRETWELATTSCMWLYEHLKGYRKFTSGIINLKFHEFEISKIKVDPAIWDVENYSDIKDYISISKPKTMNQLEAIKLCCKYLKHYINTDKRQDKAEKKHSECEKALIIQECIDFAEAQQAFHIYAEILSAMWW